MALVRGGSLNRSKPPTLPLRPAHDAARKLRDAGAALRRDRRQHRIDRRGALRDAHRPARRARPRADGPRSPAAPRRAPGAAARTGSPARSARRNRAGRPPCPRSRSARRSGRCRSGRAGRRNPPDGCRRPARRRGTSSSAAGTFTKRKPRSAISRGSMRRSATWSIEKRKPRSAMRARHSCSIGPMARIANCENSNTRYGASARFASRKAVISWNTPAFTSVEPEMLQNSPTSRFFEESRRTTCTQRNTIRLSIAGHQPARLGVAEEIVGREQRAVVRAQPHQRLVVAHLALRQRDDRLQEQVDAIGFDRARDLRHDRGVLQPLEMALMWRAASALRARQARRGRQLRAARPAAPRWRTRQAARRRGNARGRRVRDRVLQHLLVRGDRVGEFLHQVAKLADLGRQRLGCGARAVHRGRDLAFHRDEAAVELGHLAADVGGAAREVRDLAADVVAVTLPACEGIEHHQRGHRGDGGHRRLHAGEAERQVRDDARGRRDQHHAEGDEDGAEAPHVRPQGPSFENGRAGNMARIAFGLAVA